MDIQTYRELLHINKHQLDEELVIQADVMDRIADECRKHRTEVAYAEDGLKNAEAEAFTRLKGDHAVATVDKMVRLDNGRVSAFASLQHRKSMLAEWESLLEAWKARGFAIKGLSELYVAQYFTTDSIKATAYRPKIERRDYTVDQPRARKRGQS